MNDDIRLLGDLGPVSLTHAQLLLLQISHDNLNEALLDPLLVPRPPALAAVLQPAERRLGRLGPDVANDLLRLRPPRSEKIAKDEGAEEARRSGEEDRLRALLDFGLLVLFPQARDELGLVLGVLGILNDGVRLAESKIRVAQAIELLGEAADGRVVKDDAEGGSHGEALAQLEDETRGEDRVSSQVEE